MNLMTTLNSSLLLASTSPPAPPPPPPAAAQRSARQSSSAQTRGRLLQLGPFAAALLPWLTDRTWQGGLRTGPGQQVQPDPALVKPDTKFTHGGKPRQPGLHPESSGAPWLRQWDDTAHHRNLSVSLQYILAAGRGSLMWPTFVLRNWVTPYIIRMDLSDQKC